LKHTALDRLQVRLNVILLLRVYGKNRALFKINIQQLTEVSTIRRSTNITVIRHGHVY